MGGVRLHVVRGIQCKTIITYIDGMAEGFVRTDLLADFGISADGIAAWRLICNAGTTPDWAPCLDLFIGLQRDPSTGLAGCAREWVSRPDSIGSRPQRMNIRSLFGHWNILSNHEFQLSLAGPRLQGLSSSAQDL